MKKLIIQYTIAFGIGMISGYLLNDFHAFREWSYLSSKWISRWWIFSGSILTIMFIIRTRKAILLDEKQRIEADNLFNS